MNQLFLDNHILLLPKPATSDIAYSPERFKNRTANDQATIAEVYEGLSPDLQAALADDNRRPKFKYIVSLLHVPAFHLMNLKLFADNSTSTRNSTGRSGSTLSLALVMWLPTFFCSVRSTSTRPLIATPRALRPVSSYAGPANRNTPATGSLFSSRMGSSMLQ